MKELLQNLKKVIFNVFQDMFFIFPEDGEEIDPDRDICYKKVAISIQKSGETTYLFQLYFTENQGRMMTENYLGQTEEITDNLIEETLKEAANVIGGNFLNLFQQGYSLGIPELMSCQVIDRISNMYHSETGLLLEMEGEPFLLMVKVN